MSGIPTVKVEIYLDYGASWNDVSSYVRLRDGITARRGRSSQFESSSPGTMTLRLDNVDGSFSAVADYLKGNDPIRLTISGIQVWTGYVVSYRYTAVAATEGSMVELSCVDYSNVLASMKMKSYGVERATYLTDFAKTSWAVTYPLDVNRQGIGSEWGAWRNPSASPIKIWGGSAGHHEFTSEKAAPFLDGSARLVPWNQVSPVFEVPDTFNPGATTSGANGSISFWFRTSFSTSDTILCRMFRTSGGSGYVQVKIDSAAGALVFQCYGDSAGSISYTTSTVNYYDDQWHHVYVLFTDVSGTTMTVYVDGSAMTVSTSGGTRCSIGSSNRRLVFGGSRNTAWTENSYCLDGYLACISVSDGGQTSNAGNIYDAAIDGDTGTTISSRLDRIEEFVGAPSVTFNNSHSLTVAGQDLGGKSALDAFVELADSEGGQFYISRLGNPYLRGQGARDSAASVVVTLDAFEDLTSDFAVSVDMTRFANTIVMSGPAGDVQVQDATSFAAVGPMVESVSNLASTLALLADEAAVRLAWRMHNEVRLERVTVDLFTTPNNIYSDVLQLVPLDRVSVTSIPLGVGGLGRDDTIDGFVEGWELNVSTGGYTVVLDLSPVI